MVDRGVDKEDVCSTYIASTELYLIRIKKQLVALLQDVCSFQKTPGS